MNSVSGQYLHPLRYVSNVVYFLLRDLCFKLRGGTYTRTDVYGNYVCAVSAQEYYMHGIMRIGKRVNTKVKNYDLRDLDKETNMKVLNLFMSGWPLAPLRE